MKHYCFLSCLCSRYDVLIFVRQARSLVAAGFKVTCIVCDTEADEIVDGVEIVSTGYVPNNRLDRFLHSRKVLIEAARKVNADIYQISDPELISLAPWFHRMKKKVVFNMREYYPDLIQKKHYIPKILRSLTSDFYGLMMKRYLKCFDAVFIVTDWVLERIKKDYGLNNCHLLTNFPIVHTDFHLSYEEYCRRGDVLNYEGTVYVSSRQELVFQALEKLPQVHYLMAGVIDETYGWIKDLPYWKNVEFIDGFHPDELQSILSRASIANVFKDFAPRDGSLGVLKIFESMEAGLPVLLADVPLYRKINEKYHCGICVNPNDVQDIEQAIRYLVEHKEAAYQMGQNGRRAVIEEFNWAKQAENFIHIINTL